MKKNKGFSLVELIIVIAIMAILAAAIAPALIRYIDKSRKADDIAAAETVNTAVQTSMSNEDAYDKIMNSMHGEILAQAAEGAAFTPAATSIKPFTDEVNSNLAGAAPKLKYRKDVKGGTIGASYTPGGTTSFNPGGWAIAISNSKPVVYITGGASSTTGVMIQPSIDSQYK